MSVENLFGVSALDPMMLPSTAKKWPSGELGGQPTQPAAIPVVNYSKNGDGEGGLL